MKVAIFGSRDFPAPWLVKERVQALAYEFAGQELVIVSGGARGVDTWAEEAAKGHQLGTQIFRAEWSRFGRSAGFMRNTDIAEAADWGICFWDGKSRGALDTKAKMEKMGKRVELVVEEDKMSL